MESLVSSPHVEGRVGVVKVRICPTLIIEIWKWGLSHIGKIQGLECVYKVCELLLLLPIGFGMESHLSLYAWLVCLNAQLIYKNLTWKIRKLWLKNWSQLKNCQRLWWTRHNPSQTVEVCDRLWQDRHNPTIVFFFRVYKWMSNWSLIHFSLFLQLQPVKAKPGDIRWTPHKDAGIE